MTRATSWAVAAGLLTSLVGARADALSCSPCGWLDTPGDLEELPANFELRIASSRGQIETGAPVLAGPGTSTVTFVCQPLSHLTSDRNACRPATPLEAGVWYDLQPDSTWFTGRPLRVTALEDHVAPDAPALLTLTQARERPEDTFPEFPRTGFVVTLSTVEPLALAAFEVGVTPAGGPERVFAASARATAPGNVEVFAGAAGCTCGTFDTAMLESDVSVRVRVVDAAGNLGAWSAPLTAESLPDETFTSAPGTESEPPSGGCVCVERPRTNGAVAILSLGLVGLFVARRRATH